MFLLSLVITSVIFSAEGQVTSDLYPYGSGNSDNTLTNGNDLSAAVVPTTSINFYGETYTTLYVNTNGLISLGNPMTEPQTNDFFNDFPLYPDLDDDGELDINVLIAPFWADVDTSNNRGNIYYRQSTESSLLNQVTSDVRDLFVLYIDYTATWVFIATWEDVSFFNQQSATRDPRNTFQIVLTTDGLNTFAFFRYETVVWAAGTTLNGNQETGIPIQQNFQAVVGFNKGNGFDGYEDGFPNDVLNLPDDSNVDVSGLYAFKIDADSILSAGCQDGETTVYTYPVYGNMFGGERVYLNGPCWGISIGNDLKCRFTSSEGVELQVANGTVEDRQSAYCVPEPFFMVGEVTLEVSINDGDTWGYDGVYRIVLPGRVNNIGRVTRSSSSSSVWETSGNSLTITWDMAQFEDNDRLDAHVLAYREDGIGPRWEEVYTIATDVENTGSISFTPTAVEMVTEENAFGLIRVEPTNGGVGRKLYTTEHALGYILEQEYQDNPEDWSNEKCLAWAKDDDALQGYTNTLLSCPCTLDQALADSGRFQPDTGCSMFAGIVCTYHVGAKHCVRSVYASSDHAGTQCCYDQSGYLMYAGDTDQGSTSDRCHVWGSEPYLAARMVPSLSHWIHDVITFYYCCLWGTECKSYMERRKTIDCAIYEPPEHAITFGDPHIITLDNANYTFNAKGEFTLMEASNGFRLDGRFEIIPAFTSTTEKLDGATGLTAAVMFEDGSDVIQVDKDAIYGMVVHRGTQTSDSGTIVVENWERINFRDQTWLDLTGVSVTINDMDSSQVVTSLTVMFEGSSIGVNVTRMQDNEILSATVILPPTLAGSSSIVGMLGNFNNETSDDLQTRFGQSADPALATEEEIFQAGSSWMTPEMMLFRYSDKTYDDMRNVTEYNPLLTSPDESSLTSSEMSFMESTCGDITQCQFDFLVTRDQSIAMATASAEEHYRWAEEKMLKITSCTFIPTPRNGTKLYSQMEDGELVSSYRNNFVGTIIEFSCDEYSVLEGSPKRTCQSDGTYSGSEVANHCIHSTCGSLPVVENGYMVVTAFEESQRATVTCHESFILEGDSQHHCDGDEWSGVRSNCLHSPCGSLPVVENGYMVLTAFEGSQRATVTCHEGFILDGDSQHHCDGDEWSGVPSNCVPDKPNNTAIIVSSCILAGFVIILIIVIATFFKRGSRRKENIRDNNSDHQYMEPDSIYLDVEVESPTSYIDYLEVPITNVNLKYLIHGDGLMQYYKADLIGNSGKEDVVVKALSDTASVRLASLETMEIELQAKLPTHDNVIQLIGRSRTFPLYMLYELVDGKTLFSYLHENFGESEIHQCHNTKLKQLHVPETDTTKCFPKLVLQIARAMNFLTTNKFIHPGLRSEKIIVDSSGQCKLYDFVSETNAREMKTLLWTKSVPYQWMSPEYLFHGNFSSSGDVWSFGVLVWEIFSYGNKPHAGKERDVVEECLNKKQHLPLPNHCPGGVWQLMLSCWEHLPEKRPSFENISSTLSYMCNGSKEYYEIPSEGNSSEI